MKHHLTPSQLALLKKHRSQARSKMNNLTLEPYPDKLRSYLRYNASSGAFFHLRGRHKNNLAGKLQGNTSLSANPYLTVTIAGQIYHLDSLAWWFITGETVHHAQILHLNNKRYDNRYANLQKGEPTS